MRPSAPPLCAAELVYRRDEVKAPMPLVSKIILWVYVAFNAAIAGTFIVDPSEIDATYKGGAMTPTREFLWFSIASFHLFVIATVLIALRMRGPERRWLVLANAGFYAWDALTQWGFWGGRVGLAPADLHVNAGVSAVTAALLGFAAWRDRNAQSTSPLTVREVGG